MRQCDKALYRAKRDGRGRLYVHNRWAFPHAQH